MRLLDRLEENLAFQFLCTAGVLAVIFLPVFFGTV